MPALCYGLCWISFTTEKDIKKRQPFILLAVPFTAARIDHHDIGQGILLYY
jgi:hypothetical protein